MTKPKQNKASKPGSDFGAALLRLAADSEPEALPGVVPLVEDDSGHRFLVYATDKGVRVDLRYEGATFWTSQAQMAAMFGVVQPTISEHIANIFRQGELPDTEATHRKFRSVRREGTRDVTREVDHYDLNVVISVGYRVGSSQGTMFRIWATDRLFQILTKGFYIDSERLKSSEAQPGILDELRDTVREIRAATANVYREVKRICSLCADYDAASDAARIFFSAMENSCYGQPPARPPRN